MKKMAITISYDQEKLKALQFYMGKKDSDLDVELDAFVQKLYEKYVPAQTREYIESMAEPEEKPRPKRSHPTQPASFSGKEDA